MAFFGTFLYGEELFGTSSSEGPSGPGPQPGQPGNYVVRVPWRFQQISDPDVYEFAINPLDVSMPSIQKTITTEKTASGKDIVFQGNGPPQKLSFSGTILTEVHLNAMREWFYKEKQVSITDDLGRQYWVYLTAFSPTRNYSAQYPWRHEYSADATVLSW
jgi:hypothetical protein